jgi:putative ABC transport system substrate-binding protein
MRRREFVTFISGAAATLSLAARAQPASMPVIGYLCAQSLENRADLLKALRQGLNEAGYFEGQNVTIEYRSADDHAERLPTLATELVNRHVA